MSWLSSILTPSGYSQNQGIQQQQQQDMNLLNGLLPSEVSYEQELQNLRQQNLPQFAQAIQNLLQFTTQGGRNSLVQSFGQNATAGAESQGAGASAQWAGNPALATAAKLGAMNDANTSTAQYSQQINSPQYEQQANQIAAGAANELAPNYSQAQGIVNTQFNQPKVQETGGASVLGLLGNLVGGGAFNSLLPQAKPASTDSQAGTNSKASTDLMPNPTVTSQVGNPNPPTQTGSAATNSGGVYDPYANSSQGQYINPGGAPAPVGGK
jgi:hypothetical protein